MIRRMIGVFRVFLGNVRRSRKGRKRLSKIDVIRCDTASLRTMYPDRLHDIFCSREIGSMWSRARQKMSFCQIPDGSGGVNPGDRRAIFYLICAFTPRSILEIGTHIGASTLSLALALNMNQRSEHGNCASLSASSLTHASIPEKQTKLVSVDVVDVNDSVSRPWLKYGTGHSPIEMIRRVESGHLVEFVVDHSLSYLKRSNDKFDFIFLDGDHGSETVYQEIPDALNLLNEGGVLLLHDYFPGLRPLWSDGSVVPGPCLATERLKDEGADITVNSLGELPWPTKLQSNVTSLALVTKT